MPRKKKRKRHIPSRAEWQARMRNVTLAPAAASRPVQIQSDPPPQLIAPAPLQQRAEWRARMRNVTLAPAASSRPVQIQPDPPPQLIAPAPPRQLLPLLPAPIPLIPIQRILAPSSAVTPTLNVQEPEPELRTLLPRPHLLEPPPPPVDAPHHWVRDVIEDYGKECSYCGALFWEEERMNSKTCCGEGAVLSRIMKLSTPPLLQQLASGTHPLSAEFHRNIRRYNGLFCFTSSKVNLRSRELGPGVFTFGMTGRIHHRISRSLTAPPNEEPRFAQIYLLDPILQKETRSSVFDGLNQDLIGELQDMLHECNALVDFFAKNVRPWAETNPQPFALRLKNKAGRNYDLPTSSEIAALIPFNEGGSGDREIMLREVVVDESGSENDRYIRINQWMSYYDPLHYPLLFPNFESGWTDGIKIGRKTVARNITPLMFYRYRLYDRNSEEAGILQYSGRLYHEFIVDSYCKVEEKRLSFFRHNQKKIRAELYSGLQDNANTVPAAMRGRKMILPAGFKGSKRYYGELFQNSMAIVRHYGKPDFFLTFTTNPNWPEIRNILTRGLTPNDRPDLICRVFNQKILRLIDFLYKERTLGIIKAYIYSIEFQKRGLPHVHMLLMTDRNIQRDVALIDSYVCAEIPDPSDELLYETVVGSMLHQCRPRRCMKNGVCTKKFPRAFQEVTTFPASGYPHYRRRNNGRTVTKRGTTFDNRHVVPYNPTLCRVFNAHINVEVCSTVKAVKYIHKYIFKGVDHASSILQSNDEIEKYLEGRYLSATESCWRLFSFRMHKESIPVQILPVHLPNEQRVYWQEGEDPAPAMERSVKQSLLLDLFRLNSEDVTATEFVYHELPLHYTFEPNKRKWKKRSTIKRAIGRMVAVSPQDPERFALRLLLVYTPGPVSYESLRTVEGVVYTTFKEACLVRGLLHDDSSLYETFLEISEHVTNPVALFNMFAEYLIFADVSNSTAFLEVASVVLKDAAVIMTSNPELIEWIPFYYINKRLEQMGKSSREFGLPAPELLDQIELLAQQATYDPSFYGPESRPLNEKQKAFFDAITESAEGSFFLDGPGGTGKTYVLMAICSHFHRRAKKIYICAISGIAATMYPGGRTAHSLFRLPFSIDETSVVGISRGSTRFNKLIEVDVLIFDEVSMATKHVIDCLDRSFRDLFCCDEPFGGLIVIFAGDFRQILPVIRKAREAEIVLECCFFSRVWRNVKKFELTENVRTTDVQWANFIKQVGDGEVGDRNGVIDLPASCVVADSEEDMIDKVFENKFLNDAYTGQECILTPTNVVADQVNEKIMNLLPADEMTYMSLDNVEDQTYIPTEFLNNISIGGLPNHLLKLKKGCMVMCLRNLSEILTNGTRLRLVELKRGFVKGTIITNGPNFGREAIIYKVKLFGPDGQFPFKFSRFQLPLRVSYAMTINKSQCQTFKRIGLFLKGSAKIFAHGQLYVALSRVSEGSKGVVVFDRKVQNTIYRSVFEKLR